MAYLYVSSPQPLIANRPLAGSSHPGNKSPAAAMGAEILGSVTGTRMGTALVCVDWLRVGPEIVRRTFIIHIFGGEWVSLRCGASVGGADCNKDISHVFEKTMTCLT